MPRFIGILFVALLLAVCLPYPVHTAPSCTCGTPCACDPGEGIICGGSNSCGPQASCCGGMADGGNCNYCEDASAGCARENCTGGTSCCSATGPVKHANTVGQPNCLMHCNNQSSVCGGTNNCSTTGCSAGTSCAGSCAPYCKRTTQPCDGKGCARNCGATNCVLAVNCLNICKKDASGQCPTSTVPGPPAPNSIQCGINRCCNKSGCVIRCCADCSNQYTTGNTCTCNPCTSNFLSHCAATGPSGQLCWRRDASCRTVPYGCADYAVNCGSQCCGDDFDSCGDPLGIGC